MPGSLEGRVILVTGSSRGIGAEVAAMAGEQGATVAVHYQRAADGAERTLARVREAGAEGAAFQADVAEGAQAERLVADVIERFGRFPHRNAILGRPPRPAEVEAGDVVPW